jgi:hypothetical protein
MIQDPNQYVHRERRPVMFLPCHRLHLVKVSSRCIRGTARCRAS